VVAGVSALGLVVLLGIPLLMVMAVVGGGSDQGSAGCGTGSDAVLASASTNSALTDKQLANAAAVIAEGYRLGVPRRALVVALAVAHQESGFLNYANDGLGDDLGFLQGGVEDSLALPHDAVGTDHGSLGIFQQQWPWWGTMADLMNPAQAAGKFYTALLSVPGWEQLTITGAGQAVQFSAYPDAYADDVPLAVQLLSDPELAAAASVTADSLGSSSGCVVEAVYPGTVVLPLAAGSFTDLHNWGAHGAHWAHGHTGTDLSATCGTPVRAATDGIVIIRTDQAWAGRWLVQVSTGLGRLTTWYGHLRALTVADGQRVTAGQTIGEVGDLGNASGCHLHFEVHPYGGSIYADNIDPSEWLAHNLGKTLGGVLPASSHGHAGQLTLITANVPFTLTEAQARDQIGYVLEQNPDVVMLQEVPARHVSAIVATFPGNWGVWQPTPRSHGGSAIVWNRDRLDLGQHGAELGFDGRPYDHWMTWAILRTGTADIAVVGLHMPTDASWKAEMRGYYLTMTTAYQRLVTELIDQGYPPIVGGDWNHPLDRPREPWSPVPQLGKIGMTTNWLAGTPCSGTSGRDGRIDGFAFPVGSVAVQDQGCLDRRHSDHRPVWMTITYG
jgi:murein DD-endopeptidase MepM/ murein hydrolase activator NlpD